MGYLTNRAERAAVKGSASMVGPFFRLIAGVLVLFWPLGIMHHGHTTALGWIIGGVWWVILAIVAVAWVTARPAQGTRRR